MTKLETVSGVVEAIHKELAHQQEMQKIAESQLVAAKKQNEELEKVNYNLKDALQNQEKAIIELKSTNDKHNKEIKELELINRSSTRLSKIAIWLAAISGIITTVLSVIALALP